MSVKSMSVMKVGQFKSFAGRHVLDLNPNERIDCPVISYLIQTDNGNIVVDTGLDPFFATDPQIHQGKYDFIGFGHKGKFEALVERQDDIRERLKQHNLGTQDIRFVINTHLHHDHVGGNRYFTESTIIVHKEEYRFALFPDEYYSLAYDRSLWDLPSLKYELIEGDRVITPGVTVIHTPGHTPGHLAVIVDCPKDGTVVIAGDTVHNEQNFTRRVPLGADNSMDAVQVVQSIDILRAIVERSKGLLIPSHDIQFYSRMPKEFH